MKEETEESEQLQASDFSDELANRTFIKFQQLYPTQFSHALEVCKNEMLTEQLQQAHEMIEHLQSQQRPAAKKSTKKKTQ